MTALMVHQICTAVNGPEVDTSKYVVCAKRRIDDVCTKYFRYLDHVADGSRFGRRELNNVVDYASTLMGLAGSPSQQLAILSGTRVFANGSWDATDEMLMLSPAPFKVHRLVQAKQLKLYDDYRQADSANDAKITGTEKSIVTIDSAFNFVSNYAAFCTPMGIHKIVDEAVQEKADKSSDDPSKNTKLNKALQDLTDSLNKASTEAAKKNNGKAASTLSTLSVEDVPNIYAYAMDTNSSRTDPGGYLASHGLLTSVEAALQADVDGLKQKVGNVLTASPDIAQKARDLLPAPITESDLIKNAKFTLKQDGSTIQIGANDYSNKDTEGKIHYFKLDANPAATGNEMKDLPSDLKDKIKGRAPKP